jgi:hypothetical protein
MEIKIFIQQTEDGSKVVYPFGYNELAPENEKYQFFLKDEAHKADFADAYSLQIKNEFKIYSLISSEIKDYLNRSGSFFAIRLVVPQHKSINEIHSLLNNIKDRYMQYYNDKALSKLSFIDLTDAIEDNSFNSNTNSFVVQGIDNDAYELWDKTTSLNRFFTQNAVLLVNNLYIFDKEKTEPIVYERMLPFDDVKQLIRKIQITSNGLLDILKVNDVEINKPNSNSFELITTTDVKVLYRKKGRKDFKVLSSLESNIDLHQKYTEPKKGGKKTEPDSQKPILITTVILILATICILGWILTGDDGTNSTIDTTGNGGGIVKKRDINIVEFKEITTSSKDKRYQIITPKGLESFEFIYNSGWSFINKEGSNKVVDFSKLNIEDIFENKKITFNDSIKNNFIKELEKISNEKITEEVISKKEIIGEKQKNGGEKKTPTEIKLIAPVTPTNNTKDKDKDKDKDKASDK